MTFGAAMIGIEKPPRRVNDRGCDRNGSSDMSNSKGISPCAVRECEIRAEKRGWCINHYQRWQKHGSPVGGRVDQYEPITFFLNNVFRATNECILWPYGRGGFRHQYGRVQYFGQKWYVNALALTLVVGTRPGNHEAAHCPIRCTTPLCFNPRHLRWTSRKENEADKGRGK